LAFRSEKGRLLAAAACLAGLLAGPASAADDIRFLTPGASADLQSALRAASPLLLAQREDRSDAQDLFAAARAEYSALLAALYARAFYSPVITVSIDGREAASIAPLDAPATIRQIIVTVQPGPDFAFSQARIAPLAEGTRLPADFAIGKPAARAVAAVAVSFVATTVSSVALVATLVAAARFFSTPIKRSAFPR
jgi:translocation and assembly module TamA